MPVLQINDLTKYYGKFKALDGLNMTMEKGEVLGFIGPNGAGKTTTIRLLLGMLKPTQGSASIFGLDPWKETVEIHRRIAYVPGDVNLWSNLTGGEVIDLFTKLHGGAAAGERERLVKLFDFDPRKKCRAYSKGNRQKIALIAAFACDAELYILDEPTSGLDPLMEDIFSRCVEEKISRGKSVLLSSHILSEVEKLCTRVAIIRSGKMVESGTLTELRHLTRVNMTVETTRPPEGIEKISGVHNLTGEGSVFRFSLDAQAMPEAVEFLSRFGVIKLESVPPTLEELFMSHYDGNGGGAHE